MMRSRSTTTSLAWIRTFMWKGLKEYNRKCRLEGNQRVLDGNRYAKNNQDQILRNLDIMKVTKKAMRPT